ncbi:MAG: hypothetical protein V2G42_00100 [bacterium JZ-2024 1]
MNGNLHRPRLHSLLAFFTLLTVSGTLFSDVLFAGKAFFEGDAVGVGYPLHFYAARAVKEGHFPLWTPYYYFGYPFFLESQAGLLYPFHTLFYLLPLDQFFFWYHALLVMHYALAGWFTFLWLRDLTGREDAGLFAGITFMLGGYLMGHQIHLNIVEVVTWCPLVLYLMGRKEGTWRRNAICIGFVFAMQALAGHIATLIIFLPVAFAYAAWLFVRARLTGESGITAILPFLCLLTGGGIGVILSLPQTLPQLLYIPLSQRAAGPYIQSGIPLREFVYLFIPYPPGARWFDTGLFHGYLMWILSIVAFLWAHRKTKYRIAGLWSLVAFFFYLALGMDSQAYRFLAHIPPFSMLRFPGRYSLGIALFVSAISGIAYSEVMRAIGRRFRWLGFFLIIFQGANLAVFHHRVAPRTDAKWLLKAPPYLSQLPAPRVPYRLFPTGLEQFSQQGPETMAVSGEQETFPSELVSQSLALYHKRYYAPAQAWLFIPENSFSMMNGLIHHPDPALYSAFGIRYLVVPPAGRQSERARKQMEGWQFQRIITTPVGDVYENPTAKPLAYLSHSYRVLPDPWSLRRSYSEYGLLSSRLRPDYRAALQAMVAQFRMNPDTVILDRDPHLSSGSTGNAAGDAITSFQASPDGFTITGTSSSPAILVLLDTCIPGWRVTVNGKPADLYRANYFFKATLVPGGPFVARFTYSLLPVGNCIWKRPVGTNPTATQNR